MYYIYIIKCSDDSLYTGITNDLHRRMAEHSGRTKKCAKYTRSHKAVSPEAVWTAPDRSLASRLEYAVKHLSKKEKLKLISSGDLSDIMGEAAVNYKKYDRLSDE